MKNFKYLLYTAMVLYLAVEAQRPKDYEIATWYQFKDAALSYTFDDNCAKQLSVALPLFDQYGYKTTHFTVSGWVKDWVGLQKAASNGHEVTSHTVSHSRLSQLSVVAQEAELKNAQNTISSNVKGSKCETFAYPFCDIGDTALVRKYYKAGRICTGTIEQSTPKDFYAIGSIAIGNQTDVATGKALDSVVVLAKASKAWGVFLIHGIDDDGGYSPILSSDLKAHLGFIHSNSTQYWVGTFAHVFKYIKERNAMVLDEKVLNTHAIALSVTDTLDNAVYNVPITLKRILPKGWTQACVYHNGVLVASDVTKGGRGHYIVFDVVSDQGSYVLTKKEKDRK